MKQLKNNYSLQNTIRLTAYTCKVWKYVQYIQHMYNILKQVPRGPYTEISGSLMVYSKPCENVNSWTYKLASINWNNYNHVSFANCVCLCVYACARGRVCTSGCLHGCVFGIIFEKWFNHQNCNFESFCFSLLNENRLSKASSTNADKCHLVLGKKNYGKKLYKESKQVYVSGQFFFVVICIISSVSMSFNEHVFASGTKPWSDSFTSALCSHLK